MNVDCEKEYGEPSNRWENEQNQKRVKHMEKSILQIIYILWIKLYGPYIYIYIDYKNIINGFEYLNTIQEMHRKKGCFSVCYNSSHSHSMISKTRSTSSHSARWHMPAAPTRVGHRCPLQAHQSWEESSTKDWKNHVISKASKGNPPKRKALQNWKSLEYHGISAC